MTVKAAIVQRLSGRTEVRHGDFSAIAREVGCTRTWVRMTAQELGIGVARLETRPCSRCGNVTERSQRTGLCGPCVHKAKVIELICVNCGRRFERRRADHRIFLNRKVTQGRRGPVCGKDCRVSYETTCAWCGRTTTRAYRKERLLGFCPLSRPCLVNAKRALHTVHWRHLPHDLLPMKDHLPQLKALGQSPRAT